MYPEVFELRIHLCVNLWNWSLAATHDTDNIEKSTSSQVTEGD